ncbi:unnamed protein product [Amoebophrya sp. A25]|nr:unnamed protein product [Amoebophrya sp. A25]|eukprot:GSA25T00010399001.1
MLQSDVVCVFSFCSWHMTVAALTAPVTRTKDDKEKDLVPGDVTITALLSGQEETLAEANAPLASASRSGVNLCRS